MVIGSISMQVPVGSPISYSSIFRPTGSTPLCSLPPLCVRWTSSTTVSHRASNSDNSDNNRKRGVRANKSSTRAVVLTDSRIWVVRCQPKNTTLPRRIPTRIHFTSDPRSPGAALPIPTQEHAESEFHKIRLRVPHHRQ